MQGNNVVYRFVRGENGLPTIIRTEKCPGTIAVPGQLFPSTAGATPQGPAETTTAGTSTATSGSSPVPTATATP